MTTTIEVTKLIVPPGQSVLLTDLTWHEFEQILADLGESRAARIAFDRGTLEIMVPLPEHEYFRDCIGDLIKELADALQLDYECLGSTTWKKKGAMAGVEPDNCFYIQNFPAIQGRLNLDLTTDPPPDLALEVDMTNSSVDRMGLYARLGVPELWRYEKGEIKIYHLVGREYREMTSSLAFPQFPVECLPEFIQQQFGTGRRKLRQAFRAFVQSTLLPGDRTPDY